jgi:SPP1 family predicted phage head-tail adaptor
MGRDVQEAGKYNRRITIEQGYVTEDDPNNQGGFETVWVKFADVWAYVEPIRADDPYYMQQIDGRVDMNIWIRYLPGLRADWRIIYNGQIFNIMNFYDVDTTHREMRIVCKMLTSKQPLGAVTQPTITSPAANATGISLTPTITASAFAVTAGTDTQRATQWQVTMAADAGFHTPIINQVTTTDLNSITLQAGKLAYSTYTIDGHHTLIPNTYLVRVNYAGKQYDASVWSTAVSFTTMTDPGA